MSDEIYARIVYDNASVPSIAALPGMLERTIIVDGFSKTYAMTGWRLGFGIMPKELANVVQLLLTHSVGCTAQFVQVAGIEALTGPQEQVDLVVAEYQRRRDVIVDGLNAIPGVTCQRPQGAFYVFPNIKSFGRTSSEMADLLLDNAGVAVLPGSLLGSTVRVTCAWFIPIRSRILSWQLIESANQYCHSKRLFPLNTDLAGLYNLEVDFFNKPVMFGTANFAKVYSHPAQSDYHIRSLSVSWLNAKLPTNLVKTL